MITVISLVMICPYIKVLHGYWLYSLQCAFQIQESFIFHWKCVLSNLPLLFLSSPNLFPSGNHSFILSICVLFLFCYSNSFYFLDCFPGDSDDKASACSVGDPGSTPGSGRCPGEGNGNPHEYSCLENSMGRGVWWAVVHRVTKSWTWLSK